MDFKCKYCGSGNTEIEEKGTQVGLYCCDCGKWIKWLSKDEIRVFNHKQLSEEEIRADERAKVIEEIISQADIKISESHIWNLIVSRSTKDASDLSDKIVDYFMEMIKEIAEELKEKNNEQTKEV